MIVGIIILDWPPERWIQRNNKPNSVYRELMQFARKEYHEISQFVMI